MKKKDLTLLAWYRSHTRSEKYGFEGFFQRSHRNASWLQWIIPIKMGNLRPLNSLRAPGGACGGKRLRLEPILPFPKASIAFISLHATYYSLVEQIISLNSVQICLFGGDSWVKTYTNFGRAERKEEHFSKTDGNWVLYSTSSYS